MDLWILQTRITATGIQPEWIRITAGTQQDINTIMTSHKEFALMMELRSGDKFLEGIIAPSVVNPEILA